MIQSSLRWIGKAWTDCSNSCGGGVTRRNVYCARVLNNGLLQEITDDACPSPKPEYTRACNVEDCTDSTNGGYLKHMYKPIDRKYIDRQGFFRWNISMMNHSIHAHLYLTDIFYFHF